MGLKFWALPAANQRLMICEYGQVSSIDFTDEVPDSMLHGQELPDVGGVPLLFWPQGLAPEA